MMHLLSSSYASNTVFLLGPGQLSFPLSHYVLISFILSSDHAGASAAIADKPLLGEDDYDGFVGTSDFEGLEGDKSDDGDLSEEEE